MLRLANHASRLATIIRQPVRGRGAGAGPEWSEFVENSFRYILMP
jgi:hypothetical protein